MTPAQYHLILGALTEAEGHFEAGTSDWTKEDRALYQALRVIRAEVLKRESGHPFPNDRILGATKSTASSEGVATPEAISPAEDSIAAARKIRVLIVDDEASVRSVLNLMISDAPDM